MVRTPSTMLPLGTTAPDFDLPSVDGRMVDFAAAAGPKGTVVMFICNHCPFVKHVADQLAALGREYVPAGIGFAAISSNDVSSHPALGLRSGSSPRRAFPPDRQRGLSPPGRVGPRFANLPMSCVSPGSSRAARRFSRWMAS